MPRDQRDEPLTAIDLRSLPPAQHFAPKHARNDLHRLAGSASGTGRSSGSLLAEAAGLLAPIPGVDRTNVDSLEEYAQRYRERVERALALEAATIAYEDAKYRAGVVHRRIERKQAALETRARGREKPAQRRANRPVKVDVEEHAWQLVKRDALRRRRTVGEHVGELVSAATSDTVRPRHLSQRAPQRKFTRLIVDDEAWGKFRVLATDVGVSTGRLVGIIVEREARRIERGAR